MKFLELFQSKSKKQPEQSAKIPKSKFKDAVYCFKIEVPSKHYEVSIYNYTELDALYESMRIMRLTEVPTDIQIYKSQIPYDSIYLNLYVFKNKESYIKPLEYTVPVLSL